jgi:flagellum-specific peptidoglycan hydrolase FlgJ
MKTIMLLFLLPSIVFYTQTTNEVYTELLKQNVKHPDIVLAQSILETGSYKCKGCSLDKNNLFGLWNSKKKEYFYYTTWKESIGGYLRSIQSKYDKNKYKDYYDFLFKIGYASDPNYIKKLKKINRKKF